MINLACVLSLCCAIFLPEIFASKQSLGYEFNVLKGQYQKLLESNLKLVKGYDRIFKLLNSLADKDKEIENKLTPLLKLSKKSRNEICNENKTKQTLFKFPSSVPRYFARNEFKNFSAFPNSSFIQREGDDEKPGLHENGTQYLRKRTPSDGVVAFDANILASLANLGDNQKIPFKTVALDTHNAFHGDGGIFTCPRSGIYAFFATILTYPGIEIDFHINKNGNWFAVGYSKDDGESDTFGIGTTHGIVSLSTGDKIWVEVNKGGHPESGNMIYKQYSSFMGFSLALD